MNVQLALDATYCKLLEGKENWLESVMQNVSIHTNTISSYSGGLSQAYRDYSLGFQTGLGSVGALAPSAALAPAPPRQWL